MRKEDLIAFASGDWATVEAANRERWIEQARTMTPAERLAFGDELRRYAKTLHPEWPTPEQRAADLAHHIRLSELLRSVKPR